VISAAKEIDTVVVKQRFLTVIVSSWLSARIFKTFTGARFLSV